MNLIKSVIVGTAGHIDHGKTTLVKALTGIDADRLEEEKRRGITIDLGFAHLELPNKDGSLRFGFVDVPGHERFVRNMLAGVGGIDVVLLIVAADEGIMPQTREHFDICRLLGISRGITVLTKADKVSAERIAQTRRATEEFLKGSFLDASHSPIVAVSASTGEGLDELKSALADVAAQVLQRDPDASLRLPIDRVFTMKGFGTVVTGTLVSGRVHVGDELEVLPSGKRARIRGAQVHNSPVESAEAGERTALNLAGVQVEDLGRGSTLVSPAMFTTSSLLDADLQLLPGQNRIKAGARFHLHSYTSEVIATVIRFEPKTGFARLRLSAPLLLFPGDRFILRQFSPVITIGGGRILDAAPLKKTPAAELAGFLQLMQSGSTEAQLLARIARRNKKGLAITDAIDETGWAQKTIEALASGLLRSKTISRIEDIFITTKDFTGLQQGILQMLHAFHEANPLASGIAREELRNSLDLPEVIFTAAIDGLLGEKKIEEAAKQIKLAGRGVRLSDEETKARETIENAFSAAGLKVPALKDVLTTLPVDKVRAQKIVTLLLREGVLVKIGDDLVFHRSALESLRSTVREYKTKSPTIDVTRFKDMTQVSRKYAIPLLEFLDRERVTRRQGDVRVIL